MGNLKNLRPWKPGQSGNPGGRPKLPESLSAVKALGREEVSRIISKYARMTLDELDAAVLGSDTPVLELVLAKLLLELMRKGDAGRLSFLLDRALGPVKTLDDEDEGPNDRLGHLTVEELLELAQRKPTASSR